MLVGMMRWGLAPVRDAIARWGRAARGRPIHVDHVYLDQRTYIIERDERD